VSASANHFPREVSVQWTSFRRAKKLKRNAVRAEPSTMRLKRLRGMSSTCRLTPLLDQGAEHSRILAVGTDPLGHAVLLDQPEVDRVALPDGLLGEAADQDGGEEIGIASHPLEKDPQGILVTRDFSPGLTSLIG